jgi:hypothetical protein
VPDLGPSTSKKRNRVPLFDMLIDAGCRSSPPTAAPVPDSSRLLPTLNHPRYFLACPTKRDHDTGMAWTGTDLANSSGAALLEPLDGQRETYAVGRRFLDRSGKIRSGGHRAVVFASEPSLAAGSCQSRDPGLDLLAGEMVQPWYRFCDAHKLRVSTTYCD